MPKLAIIGTVEVSPGRMDDLLPVLMAHRARCLEREPGTLQFEILRPHGDDTKILIYEVYEDEAAFDRHWNGPSIGIARSEAAGMVTNITGVRCDLQEQKPSSK
jgi:quinol monooxygenase YgiN